MRVRASRRPLHAGLGLAGLVLLGFVVGIYRSGGQKLGTLNRTLRERKDTLTRLEGRVSTLKRLEERCAKLRTRLAVLEPALPTGEYMPTFLRQIETLAQDTDNHLSGIKPKPVVEMAVVTTGT
jgi:Tfp pilus assembly protein PilO